MRKNISHKSKSNQLFEVLNRNVDKNGSVINKARLKLMANVILALCKVQDVSFQKLAIAFDNDCKADSSLRRIQRFMANFHLCSDLITKMIFGLLPHTTKFKLTIDRTNWKFGEQNINIFMLGVAYKNVAFPLLFTMLNKRGNSNSEERIMLIKRFIHLFGKDCIDFIVADREFVGEEWIGYLNRERLRYHIRMRNNFKVYLPRKGKSISVRWLFTGLKNGEIGHYSRIVKVNGEYCYLSATLGRNRDKKPEYVIIISYSQDEQVMVNYKDRWQIETCFKAMKSRGFNIENTHLQDIVRIEKLVCLVMIAF
ncbi:MAG TPA: IS4 family transposase, partial [Arachidicoccus soli]|nr:IS4 family transposase [Arachidicoccus soli]